MIGSGVGMLLLSAAVGYWVLERAYGQKKPLKTIGQVVGGAIIVVSLLGTVCTVTCLATGKMPYGCMMKMKGVCPVHGVYCPMKGGCPMMQPGTPPAGK